MSSIPGRKPTRTPDFVMTSLAKARWGKLKTCPDCFRGYPVLEQGIDEKGRRWHLVGSKFCPTCSGEGKLAPAVEPGKSQGAPGGRGR